MENYPKIVKKVGFDTINLEISKTFTGITAKVNKVKEHVE